MMLFATCTTYYIRAEIRERFVSSVSLYAHFAAVSMEAGLAEASSLYTDEQGQVETSAYFLAASLQLALHCQSPSFCEKESRDLHLLPIPAHKQLRRTISVFLCVMYCARTHMYQSRRFQVLSIMSITRIVTPAQHMQLAINTFSPREKKFLGGQDRTRRPDKKSPHCRSAL